MGLFRFRRIGSHLGSGGVYVGDAIESKRWSDLADSINQVHGAGAVLVPHYKWRDATSTTETFTVTLWVEPRTQAIQRVWIVEMHCKPGTNTITAGNASRSLTLFGLNGVGERSFTLIEDLTEQSANGGEVTVTLNGSANSPDLRGVHCYEMPRAVLSESLDDGGVYVPNLESGQTVKYESVRGIFEALDGSRNGPGTNTYINWAAPESTSLPSTINTTSTSFTNIWDAGLPILARKHLRSDTTAEIKVKVRAKVSSGTGELKVSTSAGSAATQAITSTSYAWYDFVVTADCTDVDSADGRQTAASPGWDTLTVEFRHQTGTGNIRVSSVSAFDKPFDPLSLSPTLWLRGDLGVTTSGGLVTDWADQSGNGNDFTQATAADQPGEVTALNGEKAVLFNGSTHLASGASVTLPTNYVIWAVGKFRDAGSTVTVWSDAGGTELGEVLNGGTFRFTSGGATTTTGSAVVDTPVALMLDASSYPDGTPYVDNVAESAISGGADSSPVTGTFYIGSDASGTTESMLELYEFAVFDSSNVDASARAQLQSYARRRYFAEDFTPLDLQPSIWLRSDKGAAVSQWDDSSGNANHFTQATGSAQPTIVTASNGYQAFEFASGDYMEITSYTPPSNPIIWSVFEVDDASVTGYAFYSNCHSSASAHYLRHAATTGHIESAFAGTTATGETDISTGATVAGYTYHDSYPTGVLALNGIALSSATGSGTVASGTIYIGNAFTGTNPLNGRLFEFAVFDADIVSDADLASLHAYAARRYSLDDDELPPKLRDIEYTPFLDTDDTYLLDDL